MIKPMAADPNTADLQTSSSERRDDNLDEHMGFPYLYASKDNPNASAPVTEYMVSNARPRDNNDDDDGDSYVPPPFLENTEGYRIVEFYVHWCNVCKTFARQYVQLANTILSELPSETPKDSITFHAVSCAAHRRTCQHLAVTKYPVLRVYTRGDTIGVDITHAQIHPTVVMQKLGIDAVSTTSLQNAHRLEDWNRQSHHGLLQYPLLILEWIRSLTTRLCKRYLGSIFGWHSTNRFEEFPRRNRDEIRNDIHLSFDYGLRQGAFVTEGTLTDERAQILRDWFLLLRHTLPASWKVLHQCIESLIDNFDYVRRSERYMFAILDEYSPPLSSWSDACSRGDDTAGFSCGLWSLLHAITVGFVDYNRGTAFPETRLDAETVSRTIRDYIEEFFGCEDCSRKFIVAYDACAHERCHRLAPERQTEERDWIELPLWLFETHNAVNVRLLKERWAASHDGDDRYAPEASTVFWPPLSHCARCWSPGYRQWNADMMYKFLKLEYGQRDAQSMAFQKEVLAKDPPKDWKKLMSEAINIGTRKVVEILQDFVNTIENFYLKNLIPMNFVSKRRRRRSPEELRINVHLVLDMSMRHHLYRGDSKQIHALSRLALMSWLELLNKTLPPSWTMIHELLRELMNTFDHATRDQEYLKSVLDTYALDRKTSWTGTCSRSVDPPLCALWEMFHVISVGVVFHNQEVVNSEDEWLSASEVVHTIRDFLILFSGCDKCRRRWNDAFSSCLKSHECQILLQEGPGETAWKQFPIWLFAIHNEITIQIFKETIAVENQVVTAEKTNHLLWPAINGCERCWVEPGKWEPDVIYEYILQEYGSSFAVFSRDLESNFFANSYNPFLSSKSWNKISWVNGLLGIQDTGRRKLASEDIEARASDAFHRMIRNGLYMDENSVSQHRREVFRDWLELLRKTLPSSWPTLNQLVKELLDNISYVTNNKAYMVAVLEEYPISRETDTACNDIETRSLFPCGMWDLLFAIAVGSVQYNRQASDEASRLAPGKTAQTIHDAINEFLDCELCRRLFSNSFENCENKRCQVLRNTPGIDVHWVELPLWLIRTCNSLRIDAMKNVTLRNTLNLSAEEKNTILWPPKSECDRCWFDDDQLNEKVAYRFLESLYGDQGEVHDKVHEEL
jgi:hypothetical protein